MNKKIEVDFKSKITYEKMYKAYMFARRGKNLREDVIKFSLRREDYIESICYKILNESYTFGKYKEFFVYEPKKRRILAAPFRDRIVHTWYVQNFIEEIFVPKFINNSYACIRKKGMHKCALKVKRDMFNINKKWKEAYVIKMDVRKYFQNIDRNILFEIITSKIKDIDGSFLRFTKKILNSSSMYDEVEGVSLPIGNYTSQMFGNIYLDQVDKYATYILNCKYYYRYLDDTCIIVENKEKAKYVLKKLKLFYNEVLKLELNEKTQIFKLSQGINFCGYKIKIGRMFLRNKGKKKLIKKLKYIRKNIKIGKISIEEGVKSLAEHRGYIDIADKEKLVSKYFYLK